MNKHFRKVLKELKSKAQSLGFSKKELERAAAQIADNLELEEDASDEDIVSAIEEAIDTAMPFLRLAQSSASRQMKKFREEHEDVEEDVDETDENDDDEEADDEEKLIIKNKKSSKKSKPVENGSEKVPSYVQEMMSLLKKQGDEIAALKGDKTSSNRREKVSAIVGNTGEYGKKVLKAFSRMSFESDDDFEDYLEELKDDLEKENQDRANQGLEALGQATSTESNKKKSKDKKEVLSDEQVKALANGGSI